MRTFEINTKKTKTGYKEFKLILLEIKPDTCVVNETGTEYNENGLTWLKTQCEAVKDTLIDSSVTVEFADDTKTDILGHGATGEYKDGIPLLQNASTIGHFKEVYVDEIEDEFGNKITVLIGKGLLDYMRYPNCIDELQRKLDDGESVFGSVEIVKPKNQNQIGYLYGYKDKGRIPVDFEFSGYAILGCGIAPADNTASLIEVASKNNKDKENDKMDEKTLSVLITSSVREAVLEASAKNEVFEKEIAELNSKINETKNENCELIDNAAKLEKALDDMKKEYETYWEERNLIEQELASIRVEKRLSEMKEALNGFTDKQKEYAKSEIEAFKAEPTKYEVNSIISKIHEGIGKASVEAEFNAKKKQAELNAKHSSTSTIFSDVNDTTDNDLNDYSSLF